MAWNKCLPVTLTALSTCAALVPFIAFGGRDPFWFSLASGTIGGLLFSLIIILFVVPALFMSGARRTGSLLISSTE